MIVAGAGFLAYEYFFQSDAERAAAASAKLMDACRAASTTADKVDEHCARLAEKGVVSMMNLATNPESHAAAAT